MFATFHMLYQKIWNIHPWGLVKRDRKFTERPELKVVFCNSHKNTYPGIIIEAISETPQERYYTFTKR